MLAPLTLPRHAFAPALAPRNDMIVMQPRPAPNMLKQQEVQALYALGGKQYECQQYESAAQTLRKVCTAMPHVCRAWVPSTGDCALP